MHRSISIYHFLVVAAVTCGLAFPCFGQDIGAKDIGQKEVKTLSSVRLESLIQMHEIELPSRFNLALRLLNASNDATRFINFRLVPLEEPGGLVVVNSCEQPQVGLAAQTSLIVTCEVTNKPFDDTLFGFLRSILSSWSLLTMQPGEYRFLATAAVRLEDESIVTVATPITVRLRPTVWQVIAGAIVGALLLVFFAATSNRVRDTIGLAGTGWFGRLGQMIVLWMGASVSGAMFILLTFRLKDAGAPITLTVNDFYGGVVVGILGYFLTDWLATKVFASTRQLKP